MKIRFTPRAYRFLVVAWLAFCGLVIGGLLGVLTHSWWLGLFFGAIAAGVASLIGKGHLDVNPAVVDGMQEAQQKSDDDLYYLGYYEYGVIKTDHDKD
jgi:hypothetical protein